MLYTTAAIPVTMQVLSHLGCWDTPVALPMLIGLDTDSPSVIPQVVIDGREAATTIESFDGLYRSRAQTARGDIAVSWQVVDGKVVFADVDAKLSSCYDD